MLQTAATISAFLRIPEVLGHDLNGRLGIKSSSEQIHEYTN